MAKEHIDLKNVLSHIKSKYSSDQSSFEWFMSNAERLGVLNADTIRKMADLLGEKTPSTTVTKYLNFCDFGNDGRRHDVIFLIQEKYGDTFPQAVKRLAEWENQPLRADYQFQPLPQEKKEEVKPYSAWYLKKRKEEALEDRVIFKSLMEGLCRTCSLEEMRQAVRLFDIGLTSYEDEEGRTIKRLFIPEYNQNKIPFGSFRYNRNETPKGLLRRDSRRILFGSHLIKQFDPEKPIVFTEGHSDCIVNNAKGIASVTSGSSTTQIGEDSLSLLSGKTIHFYPDMDFAGIKGVSHKIMEIEAFNAKQDDEFRIEYRVFMWGESFIYDKTGESVDIKDMIKFQIETYKEHDFHAPEKARVKNWKTFPSPVAKQGYDFIDFHFDYASKEGYSRFKAKYSF